MRYVFVQLSFVTDGQTDGRSFYYDKDDNDAAHIALASAAKKQARHRQAPILNKFCVATFRLQ